MKIGSTEFCELVNAQARIDIANLPEEKKPTGWVGHVHARVMAEKKVMAELRAKDQLED